MCGIVGFIDRHSSQGEADSRLQAMLELIAHRGPDGEGVFSDETTGLWFGMRRLSIIDVPGGGQPIWNEDGTIGVVFNGEIYDYVELREELRGLGHKFSTNSDTEVLVHAYEEWGHGMLPRLRGMFGLALYDARKSRLLLARDHFGQKPLYYCHADEGFAFASEIKALLALPWVSRQIDEQSFFDFVSWHSVPAPKTHLRHVGKLAPGSFLEIDLRNYSVSAPRRFWFYDASPVPDLRDIQRAAEMLDAALAESVRLHLRADVPVGVLLSSGLDSRCVAAYAQERTAGQLQTFTVGFADDSSESVGAATTARELKTRHHEIQLGSDDLRDSIEDVAWHLDEPVGDPAAFAILHICRLASEHVKVLLGGEGADELFGGYASRYQGMMRTLERSEWMRSMASLLPPPREPYPTSRWGRLRRRANVSRGAEMIAHRVEGFPGDIRAPGGLTSRQLQRLVARQEELARHLYRPQPNSLAAITALDVDWQLAESLLLKADKMSMAASVEMRSPFLDIGVAALASRMHPHLKTRAAGGTGKLVLRECLRRRVAEPVEREKRGFPVPLDKWLRGPLRGVVEDRVLSVNATVTAFLDPKLLRSAWRGFLAGTADLAKMFYALWLYEVWYTSMVSTNACASARRL